MKKSSRTSGLLSLLLVLLLLGGSVGLPVRAADPASSMQPAPSIEEQMNELRAASEQVQSDWISAQAGLAQAETEIAKKFIPHDKVAYLTFDDGPSSNTPEILKILRENGIHATFFVVGQNNQWGDTYYPRILEEGHSLGLHSYTHRYSQIYASLDAFLQDQNKLARLVSEKTGGFKSAIYRFPGGSTQYRKYGKSVFNAIISNREAAGMQFFDWNVSGDDSILPRRTAAQITNNVLTQARTKKSAIILLHDSSTSHAVDALPAIIKGLKEQGFSFEVLSADTPPIHFYKNK